MYSPDKILKVKVTAARSNPGHTMALHTDILQLMCLPSINFLHLTVSEILPRQSFKDQGHYNKVKGEINVTTNKGHYQVSTSYTLQFLRYSSGKILFPTADLIFLRD